MDEMKSQTKNNAESNQSISIKPINAKAVFVNDLRIRGQWASLNVARQMYVIAMFNIHIKHWLLICCWRHISWHLCRGWKWKLQNEQSHNFGRVFVPLKWSTGHRERIIIEISMTGDAYLCLLNELVRWFCALCSFCLLFGMRIFSNCRPPWLSECTSLLYRMSQSIFLLLNENDGKFHWIGYFLRGVGENKNTQRQAFYNKFRVFLANGQWIFVVGHCLAF